MKALLCIALMLTFTISATAELTDSDLRKIKDIVAMEVAMLKEDINKVELRLNEKIRESERRLQTQFNTALDNRTNNIIIMFAIISIGFFLLFSAVLLTIAFLRNRVVDKKVLAVFLLSLGCLLFYADIKAQDSQEVPRSYSPSYFSEVVCTKLTVVNENDDPVITLDASKDDYAIVVRDVNTVGDDPHKPAVYMGSSPTRNVVAVYDKKGNYGIQLACLTTPTPYNAVNVHNENGESVITLDASKDAHSILFRDINPKKAAVFMSSSPTGNSVNVYGKKDNNTGIQLVCEPMRNAISLFNENDDPVITLDASKDDYAITVRDVTLKKAAVFMSSLSEGNGVTVFDKKGNYGIELICLPTHNTINVHE